MALNQALSGINAAESQLNVISNNIANAGTVGFKGSTAQFAEVYAVTGLNLSSAAVGSGVEMTGSEQQFAQGDLETTNGSLDMAISGNGFFVVNNGSGNQYTRDGAFTENSQGYVVDASGGYLQVYPPNGSGTGFNTSTLSNLQLNTSQAAATATSTITSTTNLDASDSLPTDTPFSTTDANSYNNASTFTVYDSQGGSHNATVYYVKTGNNTWDANLYIDGNSAGTATMTFNSAGTLVSPANGNLSFTPTQPSNGATFPATITMNASNMTQYGSAYSPDYDQNGYAAGVLENVEVGTDGIVTAIYSNNDTVQLGQIAVANFPNLNGLQQVGNNNWVATQASGIATMGTAGVGQYGDIEQGQLETSNTSDTTAQLVDMIQAQQDYQANSQMLGTVSSLDQALFQAVDRS
ncbi:MAG TPA: flagellar hook protein FlgE [Dyella sp.]|uniref:flagellar hook protein FlgE n=1 Tax=Dyella sp. TaxID=1869338 RepID=UPI002C781689|nr:flagellar hook protein FlgE [Dyella sp.]HTV86133.1 flagellar hook protein FlgE [Dyella sp.]